MEPILPIQETSRAESCCHGENLLPQGVIAGKGFEDLAGQNRVLNDTKQHLSQLKSRTKVAVAQSSVFGKILLAEPVLVKSLLENPAGQLSIF